MNVNAVENGVSSASYATESLNNELDKNAFLLLLVTQMQYQDPLEPQTNEQFIAQLAQFSSLEQMENLNKNFEAQSQYETLTGAARFIGLSIDAINPETETAITGEVKGIEMWQGEPMLVVNDTLVQIKDVINVYKMDETA